MVFVFFSFLYLLTLNHNTYNTEVESNKAPLGHSWSYEGGAGRGPNAGKDEETAAVVESGKVVAVKLEDLNKSLKGGLKEGNKQIWRWYWGAGQSQGGGGGAPDIARDAVGVEAVPAAVEEQKEATVVVAKGEEGKEVKAEPVHRVLPPISRGWAYGEGGGSPNGRKDEINTVAATEEEAAKQQEQQNGGGVGNDRDGDVSRDQVVSSSSAPGKQ
jgi:hypothetical protein